MVRGCGVGDGVTEGVAVCVDVVVGVREGVAVNVAVAGFVAVGLGVRTLAGLLQAVVRRRKKVRVTQRSDILSTFMTVTSPTC
jgi:hypothetical protein